MALNDWEKFRGVTSINHDQYNENLFWGLIYFLRWSALQIGAFQNISHLTGSAIAGGDYSRLRPTVDPRFTNGQVWETFRSDLVWETGISYTQQPTKMSGVFVNDTWYPTPSSGTAYEHYVDYPNGRVVFSSPISTSSVVKSDFAHRTMGFVDANTPWFQELMYDSYSVDRSDFLTAASGQWSSLPEIRRQLPVIGVEVVDNRTLTPYALGEGQWVSQDVLFYIMSTDRRTRNQWVDVLSFQNDRTINLPNRKMIKESANYPFDLDARGMTVRNPIQYPQLIAESGNGGFLWTNAMMENTRGQMMDTVNGWLYRGVVRSTFTTILPYI